MSSSSSEVDLIKYKDLHKASLEHPAIDNHAHPLLTPNHRSDIPFEGLISEAQDDALDDAVHTLACYRATAQLARLFFFSSNPSSPHDRHGDSEIITWDQVKAHRDTLDYGELCRKCFAPTRIQCILIDDGLNRVDELAVNYRWHDAFTYSPTKRIVRIEKLAEDILSRLFAAGDTTNSPFLSRFTRLFQDQIHHLGTSDNVVAFKSVICYRTGLDVSVSTSNGEHSDLIEAELVKIHQAYQSRPTFVRVQHKALNDHLVRITLEIAAKFNKPVQFHTGLGDNDINLATSSPAHLQPLIKAFPNTKFVLLHASYPFTREAAYLASAYKNVHLDFGEIFPLISADGQRETLRQALELCPTNKIMWSTDGRWWPESYYLGTIQARQALYEVLANSVDRHEITETQAVKIAQNALFHNANVLYNLNLEVAQF